MKIDDETKIKIESLFIDMSQVIGKIEAYHRDIEELKAEIMEIIENYESGT